MTYTFAQVKTALRRFGLILFIPAIAVCSGDTGSRTIQVANPGVVNDLTTGATTDATIALSFTQVDDGSGSPANYDVRYASGSMSWGSASSVASGSCATPVHGSAIGSPISCVVQGLTAATAYTFQLVAFRGSVGAAVYGGLSNIASASTTGSSNPPPPPPPPPVVTTVTVSPSSASIAVGATTTLQATVKDQNGATMSGQTVTWSTSSASVATVNASGTVTGAAAGSVTITATCAGKAGTATVTVTAAPPPPPVATTVTVAPPSASIAVGATVTLQATVKDQNGNVMTGQTVTWSTSNSSVATVNPNGVVSGVSAGSATITATSSGKSGTSTITVTAPSGGGTILFQEPFEGSGFSAGWYDNTSVLMSTSEHTANSTASAQYHFLVGATTPTTGGAQRHKFTASNSVYIRYNLKFSSNWVGSTKLYHPHEIYVMSTLDADYDGPSNAWMTLYLEHSWQGGGKPRLSMQDNKADNTSMGTPPINLVGVTEDRSTGGCNGISESNIASECFQTPYWYNDKQLVGPVVIQDTPGTNYKGDWNLVEAYFQLNTIVGGVGQPDGVMQYWFNGTLIIDRHDIMYRTGARATLQFDKFLIAPYIGDGSPVDQSMFIDNLVVATARVP
jgi:hypothetical protein